MKVSDHTMTLLTGLVLTVTVGMLAQNSDSIMSGLAGGNVLSVADDFFTVRAGRDQKVDILMNDKVPVGLGLDTLVITEKPKCGSVGVDDGAFVYSQSESCNGPVTFAYCLEESEGCAEARVSLNVLAPQGRGRNADSADEAEIARLPVSDEPDAELAAVPDPETGLLPDGTSADPGTPSDLQAAEMASVSPEPLAETDASGVTSPVLAQTVTVGQPEPPLLPEPVAESDVSAAVVVAEASAAPADPAPAAPLPACTVEASAEALRGGKVRVILSAPCHPDAPAHIAEGAFAFNTVTGPDGRLDVTIPAFAVETEIGLTLAGEIDRSFSVQVPDAADYLRVALLWTGEADLDLHAAEFGAGKGDPGYVWQQAPGSARQSRNTGGGYLELFGAPGGWSEVYTLPLSSRLVAGVIDLSVHVADDSASCGEALDVAILQSAETAKARVSNVRFTAGPCGASMAGYEVKHAIGDIRLAAR